MQDKLAEYVRYGRKRGCSREQIEKVLSRYSYDKARIAEAFKDAGHAGALKAYLKTGGLVLMGVAGLALILVGIAAFVKPEIVARLIG